MRWLFLIPAVYLAAVIETALGDVICIGHVGPDLLGLAAVTWMLLSGSPRAPLTAGAIGLLGDLIGPGQPGLGMALFLLVGYGAARLHAGLSLDHFVWQVGAVWVAATLTAVALGFGRWLMGETSVPLATLLARGLGVGLYTAGVALPVLLVIAWLRESFDLGKDRFAELSR
jgi:cell shape-determining protein MreD